MDEKIIWPQKKANSQLWALLSYESPNHYSLQSEKEINRHIDLYFNYSKESDLPISFVCPWGGIDFNQFYEYPTNLDKKEGIVSFISDCNKLSPTKKQFLVNLKKLLKIDFYGNCFENQNKNQPLPIKKKLEILKNYKFLLEIENDQLDGFFFFKKNIFLFFISIFLFFDFMLCFSFYSFVP